MKRITLTALIALVAAISLWLMTSRKPATAEPGAANETVSRPEEPTHIATTTPESPDEAAPDAMPAPPLANAVPAAPKRPAIAAAIEPPAGPEVGPNLTPITVLENMRAVFRQYSSRFGGNPVGNNAEITTTLNGGNPRQVVFLQTEDGLRINERGQLVDNWNTPFFFHQLSGTTMEIHSAGPDRKMWTSDDLVLK